MGYREEIDAANRQGKDHEERWKLRAAVREKYGMGEEKRKRGGVAGVYDRNKKVITPIAELAAGALGGPWAGAAVGGLMKGFDREGKGGIGFDVGQGLKGGLEGAAVGSVGDWGRGAIQNHLAKRGMGAGLKALPAPGAASNNVLPQAAVPSSMGTGAAAPIKPGMMTRVGNFVKSAPQAVGGAFTAGAQMMDSASQRRIAGQQAGQQAAELDFLKQKYADEQAERKRRADIAKQLYQQIMGQMSYNSPGGA